MYILLGVAFATWFLTGCSGNQSSASFDHAEAKGHIYWTDGTLYGTTVAKVLNTNKAYDVYGTGGIVGEISPDGHVTDWEPKKLSNSYCTAQGESSYDADGFLVGDCVLPVAFNPNWNQGAAGADGKDGINGINGASAYQVAVQNGFVGTEDAWLESLVGADSRVSYTNEMVGGSHCSNGGVGINVGTDINKNGVLDASEITDTSYSCNGENTLVNASDEASGTNCQFAGIKLDSGVDTNGNKELDSTEVESTEYICNGDSAYTVAVQNGFVGSEEVWLESLVGANSITTSEAIQVGDATCPNGGYNILTGTDVNKNGVLDTDEINTTAVMCNGTNTLVDASDIGDGAGCSDGGVKVDTGTDTNGNSVLDANEVESTSYVCNGAQGATGATGADGEIVFQPTTLANRDYVNWKVSKLLFSNIGNSFWETSSRRSFVMGENQGILWRYRNLDTRLDIQSYQMNWSLTTGNFTGGNASYYDERSLRAYTSGGGIYFNQGGTTAGIKISTRGKITLIGSASHNPSTKTICFTVGGSSCVTYSVEYTYAP